MADHREPLPQWTLDVTVFHSPDFGHRIKAAVLSKRGNWFQVGQWEWTGLGIPAELLVDVVTRVNAVIEEHLVTRYGVQGTLPMRWAGDPEPF